MDVTIRVPTQLRSLADGASTVVVEVAGNASATVGGALDALARVYPALERRVRDEQGRTRTHVNLFVGQDNVRDLDGAATSIPPGTEVAIIAAVSGG